MKKTLNKWITPIMHRKIRSVILRDRDNERLLEITFSPPLIRNDGESLTISPLPEKAYGLELIDTEGTPFCRRAIGYEVGPGTDLTILIQFDRVGGSVQ